MLHISQGDLIYWGTWVYSNYIREARSTMVLDMSDPGRNAIPSPSPHKVVYQMSTSQTIAVCYPCASEIDSQRSL